VADLRRTEKLLRQLRLIATPADGITVDGDLSDWPEGLQA